MKIDTGNLVTDPLYLALDALYSRGWVDLHKGKDHDPRGTVEWQAVLDLVRLDLTEAFRYTKTEEAEWQLVPKEWRADLEYWRHVLPMYNRPQYGIRTYSVRTKTFGMFEFHSICFGNPLLECPRWDCINGWTTSLPRS